VPLGHVETSLLADKAEGVAGEAVTLTVRSNVQALLVFDENDQQVSQPLPVTAGKATLTIPADKVAGHLRIEDAGSNTNVKVTVVKKP